VVVDTRTENLGRKITGLDFAFNSMSNVEYIDEVAEEKVTMSLYDMLEYVNKLSGEIVVLRRRTREA